MFESEFEILEEIHSPINRIKLENINYCQIKIKDIFNNWLTCIKDCELENFDVFKNYSPIIIIIPEYFTNDVNFLQNLPEISIPFHLVLPYSCIGKAINKQPNMLILEYAYENCPCHPDEFDEERWDIDEDNGISFSHLKIHENLKTIYYGDTYHSYDGERLKNLLEQKPIIFNPKTRPKLSKRIYNIIINLPFIGRFF